MALRFSGTAGNYLQLGSPPPATGFSICGWGTLSADRNAMSTLFAYEQSSAFAYQGIDFDTDGTTLGIEDSGSQTALLSLSVGDKFFWCLTCSGAGATGLVGYAAKAGDSALVTVSRNLISTGAIPTYFRLGDNGYSEPYNGAVDNVIVYDSVLTAAEVNAQWRRRVPIKTPWSWLSTLESTPVYTDRSGSGRNWTLTGSALLVEDGAPVGWGGSIINVSRQTLIARRATVLVNGVLQRIATASLGTGAKPLVLDNGVLKQRAASEGSPIILLNGGLKTLDSATESLEI